MVSSGNRGSANPAIWFGLIGGLLAAINNIVATLGLGVAQGPIVAFTTPFAFALGRLLFPKLPAATAIYIPLVIVSIFTLNLGPPGVYKLLYLAGAILYDGAAYLLGIGRQFAEKVPLWRLLVTALFYPIGLLLGAVMIVSWFTVEVPLLSKGWALVPAGLAFLWVIGLIATWACHRIYYKFIAPELEA